MQSTHDDTLSGILVAIRGMAEAVRAQIELTQMVLRHMQKTQDWNIREKGTLPPEQ